jgi:hypothetical protein
MIRSGGARKCCQYPKYLVNNIYFLLCALFAVCTARHQSVLEARVHLHPDDESWGGGIFSDPAGCVSEFFRISFSGNVSVREETHEFS